MSDRPAENPESRIPSEIDPLVKAPKGSRCKGTFREVAGWILVGLWPFGLYQSIKDPEPLGSDIMTMLLWAVAASGLIAWSRSLKAKKIVVLPKALRATPSKQDSSYLQEVIAQQGDRGRVELCVMERHRDAAQAFAAQSPNYKPGPEDGSGALAAWADIIPEPKNTYDSKAVQAHVMGKPVGYFPLGWKDEARKQLRINLPHGAHVPVVVRWWNGRAYVWAFSSFAYAQSFAGWAVAHDRD